MRAERGKKKIRTEHRKHWQTVTHEEMEKMKICAEHRKYRRVVMRAERKKTCDGKEESTGKL